MEIERDSAPGRSIWHEGFSAGHFSVSIVVSIVLLLGCPGPDHRATQEAGLGQNPEYSDVASEADTVSSKADRGVFSELFGDWSVVRSSCPGICAMSNEEANSWVGLTASLTEFGVAFGGYSCQDTTYESHRVSKLDFLRSSRFDLEELGILTEEVQELTVSCEDQEWIAPGSSFLVRDKETIIASWDGVYFELKRARPKAAD